MTEEMLNQLLERLDAVGVITAGALEQAVEMGSRYVFIQGVFYLALSVVLLIILAIAIKLVWEEWKRGESGRGELSARECILLTAVSFNFITPIFLYMGVIRVLATDWMTFKLIVDAIK